MKMMKKKYIKPTMEVYEVNPTQLLNSSPIEGVDQTEVKFGEGYPV